MPSLLTRLRARADAVAAGSAPPAGVEPGEPGPLAGARERGRMRRRLRAVREARDQRLLELGALVFEMHRHDRRDPDLLAAGMDRVAALDAEERALAGALGQHEAPSAAPALATDCPACRAPLHPGARFCAACGTAASPPPPPATAGTPAGAAPGPAASAAGPPAATGGPPVAPAQRRSGSGPPPPGSAAPPANVALER